MKKRVYEIIERAKPNDTPSKIFDFSIIFLIILNVIAVIVNSFSNLSATFLFILKYVEIVSIAIFSVEYTLRLWTADMRYKNLKAPRIRYIFSFMALIDLLAILPFFLPFIIPFDLRFLRMLRLLRLLRIFKINRYNDAMDIISKVLKKEKEKLYSDGIHLTVG